MKKYDLNYFTYAIFSLLLFVPLFHLSIMKATEPSLLSYTYYLGSLFAQYLCFIVIFSIPCYIFSFLKTEKIFKIYCAVFYTLFLCVYFLDYKIFEFFNMHFSSIVIEILSTKAGRDSLGVSNLEIVISLLVVTLIFTFFYFLFSKLFNKNILLLKKRKVFWLIFFLALLLEKGIFAYGHLFNQNKIVQVQRIVPLHQPLTLRRFARKHFNYNVADYIKLKNVEKTQLNYPKKKYDLKIADNKKINFLFIIIDCFRSLSLNAETTPFLYKKSLQALQFNNHFSGGNGTRDGLFSLFYSLPGPYWKSFLAERQSPFFTDMLRSNDYKQRMYSARPTSFPDIRSTLLATYPDENIIDKFEGESKTRDRKIIAQFKKDLDKDMASQSYFNHILFFDSAHSQYSFDDEKAIFKPYLKSYSYSTITPEQVKVGLKNRYKNALHFLDRELKDLFSHLEEQGALKNTVVIVTGDHGEEFYEHGNIGHSGAFNKEQTQVPFLVFHPKLEAQVIDKWTQHYDVIPTLMDWLGLDYVKTDIGIGRNLITDKGRDYTFSCSWDRCSIMDKEGWVLFGAPGFHPQLNEYRGVDYKILDSVDSQRKSSLSLYFSEILRATSDYYKK